MLASGDRKMTVAGVCEYLSAVGLCAREYANREVNASLSGGELKRIEIAMILARGTKLSVFDEPEAGDIVVFRYPDDETGKTLAGGEHRLLNEFLPQEEVLRRMVVSDFQVPWNKLYRRKLLENLRYPENKAFEDTCLMPVIYARAASACGVWDFLYNYRIVTGSAMHRKTTLKTLDWVEAWYRLFDVLYQNGITDTLCAAYRPIFTALWGTWFQLTPEQRRSPRMQEAFDYERTARRQLRQAHAVTPGNIWAALVCAVSVQKYLDRCRRRAEKRK